MKQISSSDPNILIFRTESTILTLVGISMACIGIFALKECLWNSQSFDNQYPLPMAFFSGIFLVVVGILVGLERKGVEFYREEKAMVKWWGLYKPLFRKHHSLMDYDGVALSKEIRKGKNSEYILFVLKLVGIEKELVLGESYHYFEQKIIAKSISHFTSLKILDSTRGEIRIIEPADEKCLAKRLKGKATRSAKLPSSALLQYKLEDKNIYLEITPRWKGTGLFLACLIAGIWLAFFLMHWKIFPYIWLIIVSLMTFICISSLGIFIVLYFSLFGTEIKIMVARDKMSVLEKNALWSRKKDFLFSEIEDMQLLSEPIEWQISDKINQFLGLDRFGIHLPGHCIMLCSNIAEIYLGRGLCIQELEWLYMVIENSILDAHCTNQMEI